MNSVLVLNSQWRPIDIHSLHEAKKKVCRDKPRALFVDPETLERLDYGQWIESWDDAIRSAKNPEIIVLTEYDGDGQGGKNNRPPKFSRRNVYLRDKNTCQYCGKKCSTEESNLDHVIPKSKGGPMNWKNIVVACIPCNNRKRDMTPAQANMSLIRQPFAPKAGDLKRRFGAKLRRKLKGNVRPSWENFLGKMYWDVGLKD